MQIYIACLAAYNSGYLHGKWIDVSSDEEEMKTEAQKVIKTSPVPDAEEWAIHDYDDFPKYGGIYQPRKNCRNCGHDRKQ